VDSADESRPVRTFGRQARLYNIVGAATPTGAAGSLTSRISRVA
jgi:hypothetical protein